MITQTKRGLLLVISSPSGGGKTTLCDRLRAEFPDLTYSISFTTRPMRKGEINGVHYHFVSPTSFEALLERGAFAEWAKVHRHLYGTLKESLDMRLAAGKDVLFDLDWQGAVQLKKHYPKDAVLVFLLPPSMEELEKRLRDRGTDSEDEIQRRLEVAEEEIGHQGEYDYLIVNGHPDFAYDDLRSVYQAARLSTYRLEAADG